MKKRISFVAIAVLVVVFVAASAHTVPVEWNGHLYQVVDESGLSWLEAETAAGGLGTGWILATITSQGEQGFIAGLLSDKGAEQFWVGGFQDGGQSLRNGWRWVTGEAWDYANWAGLYAQEPNDWGQDERFLTLDGRFGRNWSWNDASNTERVGGFVAESVPEPATIMLLGAGLLGLAGIRRKMKI